MPYDKENSVIIINFSSRWMLRSMIKMMMIMMMMMLIIIIIIIIIINPIETKEE
jgi:hypothetical protein